MDNETLLYLKKFYDSLVVQLIEQKKFQRKITLLGSMMDLKSNARYSILQKSAIPSREVPDKILESLIANNYIQELDQDEGNTITAIGIYIYEIKNKLYGMNNTIIYINKKFFVMNKKGIQLTEKEKIILFFLICIRAFSTESALDLKKDVSILDEIQKLLLDCYDFLYSENIISNLKKGDLFGKKGNEHPVSNLIRHSDALPKKTKGIYKTIFPQKYYLKISKDNIINTQSLGFLFWQIFGDKPQISNMNNIYLYCNKIAYHMIVNQIFYIKTNKYQHPKYDIAIEEAVYKYFKKRNIWSINNKVISTSEI